MPPALSFSSSSFFRVSVTESNNVLVGKMAVEVFVSSESTELRRGRNLLQSMYDEEDAAEEEDTEDGDDDGDENVN